MNFGSKLNRVRLQADRLFLRADKTDVVGELREAEEQVEELRILCDAFHRSLEKKLNTHSVIEEKKFRKVPENQVAETLKDALKEASQNQCEEFPEKHLFRTVIEEIIAVEQLLGKVILDHEEKIEVEVLTPLNKLLKEDFPTLSKQKKSLKQAGQDLDAAKARLRNSQTNVTQTTKLDSYREEQDEAESKLEQIRDAYACDLFSVLGKQREVSRLFILYLEIKLDHLQKSLTKLNKVLPPIRKTFENSSCSPIYGIPLHEHLRFTEEEIAIPIQICVKHMIEYGIREEGLLRMAGSNTKIKRLKALFDAGFMTQETLMLNDYNRDYDIHVIAGAFKSYLRELPEPLMTHVKHDELIEAIRKPDHDEKLRSLWQVINALPQQNYANLKYVIKFLSLLASYSSENKMTHNNIAIVMAPNLIGSQKAEDTEIVALGRNMTMGNDYRTIVEQLIEYCDYFFKGDFDFGVQPKPPPSPKLSTSVNGNVSQSNQSSSNLVRAGSHRRTGSTDFNVAAGTITMYPEIESPKQPHRIKKKPAPLPPPSESVQLSMPCNSPELRRSKTPPSSMSTSTNSLFMQSNVMSTSIGPFPAPRLQHSNSIKRPTAEPPKPPGSSQPPVKPPRPSPPQHSLENQTDKPPRPHPPVLIGDQTSSESINILDNSDYKVHKDSLSGEHKLLKDLDKVELISSKDPIASETKGYRENSGSRRPREAVIGEFKVPQETTSKFKVNRDTCNKSKGLKHLDAIEKSNSDSTPSKTNAPLIGFERLESNDNVISLPCIDLIPDEFKIVEITKGASNLDSNNSPAPIGFVVDEVINKEFDELAEVELRGLKKEGNVSTSEFRKSLEDALRHQPQTHPRHLKSGSDTHSNVPSQDNVAPIQLPAFPVPAMRPSKEINFENKAEPASRSDKPMVPEKPSVVNRSVVAVDYSRPIIPEKPAAIHSKQFATNASSIGTEADSLVAHNSTDLAINHDPDNSSAKEKPFKPPKPNKPATFSHKLPNEKESFTKGQSDSCSSDEDKISERNEEKVPSVSEASNQDATHL